MKRPHHILIIVIFFWACIAHSNQHQLTLPLDQETVWTYEIRGYTSYAMNVEQPPNVNGELAESSSLDEFYESSSLKIAAHNHDSIYDTIDVFVETIEKFGDNSTRFIFNIDFIRYWGKEIILSGDGYQLSFGNSDQHYLIKFPAQLNTRWTNKYTFISEDCVVTAIDTTIRIGNMKFEDCIEITIFRSEEGMKSTIKMYMNEEEGLVHYKDHSNQDELKLLRKYEK